MKIQRKGIQFLSLITIISVLSLIFIQWQWLKKGATLSQDLSDKKMGLILQEVKQYIKPAIPLVEEFVGGIKGQTRIFENPIHYSPAEKVIAKAVEDVFQHNGLQVDYQLRGKITDGPCIFHSVFKGPYEEDWMLHNPNQICLCHFIRGGTFDFIIELENPKIVTKEAAGLMLPSLLFLFLLLSTFFYTIYIISRQKKLSELKTDFINNLTHEFKTPIFTIGLSSGMLGKSELIKKDEKLKSYVDLIGRENQRLRNQVDKVLQIAVIDSGNFTLEKKVLDINRILENVVASFKMAVESRGGKLELNLFEGSLPLSADETHLSNALYNLVDNAFKYSKQQPEISISSNLNAEGIQLKITDKGIGMNQEIQQKIFVRFYRAQSNNVHDVKGFGLGLSYVRTIIEMHKGSIQVSSKKNEGTTFSIQFPNK